MACAGSLPMIAYPEPRNTSPASPRCGFTRATAASRDSRMISQFRRPTRQVWSKPRMSHKVPDSLIKAVEPYVYGRYSSIPALYGLARHVVEHGIPGDYIECGVARGGSAAIVGAALADEDRRLWLYDSFEGLPEPTPEDGAYAADFVGEYRGSIADVHGVMDRAGVPLSKIETIAG